MVFVYFDHVHEGRPCFRSKCEDPEYTDCRHPAVKSVVNGEIHFVDGVVHDECPSCRHKVSEAVKATMSKMGFGPGHEPPPESSQGCSPWKGA